MLRSPRRRFGPMRATSRGTPTKHHTPVLALTSNQPTRRTLAPKDRRMQRGHPTWPHRLAILCPPAKLAHQTHPQANRNIPLKTTDRPPARQQVQKGPLTYLLNRGKSGATLSASDVMNNYELGQSHARDLQVLLHGQANASSSPPEVTRDGPWQTNRTEPPMVMMTSLPDRVQLPLNGNEPQSPQPPTTPSVEIWEESMISPSPEDEPPIPVTPHRDQTPNKKEPPHRPHARPSSPTLKPKRWIPRHAVEMEYKSLRKTLSSMAVEAVLLSIGLFVDIVAKKVQEQSKAVKLQFHCLRGVLMETRLWPTSKLLQYPMTRLFVEPVVRQGSLGTIFSIGTGSGSRRDFVCAAKFGAAVGKSSRYRMSSSSGNWFRRESGSSGW
ncbi:hypothetical protein quinque_013827 [Culex quinquefasciatus]